MEDPVALLAEGVDRNFLRGFAGEVAADVALLAEGVDRNHQMERDSQYLKRSPSSRRAWIEIPRRLRRRCSGAVALLAEGVDRNPSPVAA